MNLPKTNFTVGWTQTFDPHCMCMDNLIENHNMVAFLNGTHG